jgi:hypothetical protein
MNDMEGRRLTLIVSNPGLSKKPEGPSPFSRTLYLVPDSDLEIRALVKRFSAFLLEQDDTDPIKYLRGRRKFDTNEIIGAINCLSPKAVDSLRADLMIIAQLSLRSSLRHAAMLKMAEAEFLQ